MSAEAIDAIRAVRLAAHGLRNACAAVTGGTEMAISIGSIDVVGRTTRGLAPSPIELRKVRDRWPKSPPAKLPPLMNCRSLMRNTC